MKKIVLLWIVLGITQVNGQYYNSALGLSGAALQNSLHTIITTNHVQNTYNDLWSYYGSTDIKNGNQLWDIYSDGNTSYTFIYSTEQCSSSLSPTQEGNCYNREHTWPAYYFNDFYPMYADLFHVMPTDGYVNNKRNNFPYGKVNTVNWQSENGSKLGVGNTYTSYSSSNPNHYEFEPIDSFKGDVARNYFYMSTRYKGLDGSWYNWEMANGANLTQDAITLLLSWHHLDPVSQKEIDRNNAVFAIQQNRNPFIDYPIFADCIWGNQDCTSLSTKNILDESVLRLFPNPASDRLTISSGLGITVKSIGLFDLCGRSIPVIYNEATKSIELSNLSKGLYIVVIETPDGVARRQVSKM